MAARLFRLRHSENAYRRWFVAGLEPGREPNVSESLREIQDQDPERVLELADFNIDEMFNC